ncbi:MAG: ribosome-associated translation inhibitor RaiA [Thermoanaerobaculum sp.]|nr:ribosome-associated translation inhibitor RaiA [Thermoanaerobaculum sp.]
MEFEIITRNVELTPKDQNLVKKKVGRLAKYFREVHEARITFAQEKHRMLVDGYIRAKGAEIAASAEKTEWSAALQEVVERLEEQARRLKQKVRDRRQKGSGREPAWELRVVEAESVRSGTPRIVETTYVPVRPMTVEEAALELDSSKQDFIVFRDAESDQINVLYRRRDKTYGLVTPET